MYLDVKDNPMIKPQVMWSIKELIHSDFCKRTYELTSRLLKLICKERKQSHSLMPQFGHADSFQWTIWNVQIDAFHSTSPI